MKRLRCERETSITMNDEDAHAIVWTCQKPMLKKMLASGCEICRDDGEGKSFYVPKKWISVRKPKVMNLSPERRKAMSEAFKARLKGNRNGIS